LAKKPGEGVERSNFLSLAMELLNFNPYTLSPSFQLSRFGELI